MKRDGVSGNASNQVPSHEQSGARGGGFAQAKSRPFMVIFASFVSFVSPALPYLIIKSHGFRSPRPDGTNVDVPSHLSHPSSTVAPLDFPFA